jgi:metal-responsive CopG/Arc/MetJ family transcriptional regulator
MLLLELIVSMPTKQPVITMVFSEKLLEQVEDYRYDNRIPTRTEAIRQLLEKGLKQYEKETKK